MSYTYSYPRMLVTVDVVAFLKPKVNSKSGLKVLLIRRGNDPFKGQFALPGGFPEMNELLADAATRELMEETGISVPFLNPIGFFDGIDRDPRDRNISIAYWTVVGEESQPPTPGDDAADALWVPTHRLPELAFDHNTIVESAIRLMEGSVV